METIALKSNKKEFWLHIIKAVLIAISFSLVCILVFALIVRFTNIPDKIIMPINQVIKIISIFLGCFFILRKANTKGLLKGLVVGFIYTIFAYVIFSLLSRTFTFNFTLFNDVVFGTVIGGLCGIISVNLQKR